MATLDNNDPRPVLRQELARVFKNQRVIRAFEQIFDLVPPEFINQQVQIDALNLIAEFASSEANAANASIERLTSAIERLAMAPPVLPQLEQDDLSPRQEVGTLGNQQADQVDIKGGSITVSTTDLMSTNVALTNGAGAAAGTLGNAPTAGNPTKWVQINDNGTIRKIPTWT